MLASCSPRRIDLLSRLGLSFETDRFEVDESSDLPVADRVRELSVRKASFSAKRHPDRFILAADTLVSLEGDPLGKPAGPEEAAQMLRRLSGRTHQVYTGVCVVSPSGEVFSDVDCTDVTFGDVGEEEILAYVRSGEPLDKAGAYALQGRAGAWVVRLEGSPSSVIGLPLHLVRNLLLKAGYPLLAAFESESQSEL